MRRTPLFFTLLPLCAGIAGCSFSGDHREGDARVSFSNDSALALTLGPDDVRIQSTDNNLVLAVIGDSVRIQLSDSLRAAIKQELDTAGGDSKLASAIVKSVSNVVNSALGFAVRAHVASVQDLRYDQGRIRFRINGDDVKMGEGKYGGDDAEFTEEDARRFIEAVEARQRAAGMSIQQ